MKEKKYRIKLKNGRIIGPFSKKDIGELFLKGHIDGNEKCQYFPVGDWGLFQEFKELSDYIYKIEDQKLHDENVADEIEEYKYEKQTQIDINYDDLDKGIDPPQQDVEKTKIVQRKSLVNIEKTLVKHPQQKDLKEKVHKEEKPSEKQPVQLEAEEQVSMDADTKVLNARSDMALVKEEAESFELESDRVADENKKREKRGSEKNKLKKIKITSKKKMTPIVALAIFVLVYFLLFDDDGNSGKINPKTFNVKVPVAYRVENKSKASRLLNSGTEYYNKGGYLNKLKAAEYFYSSVSHQYRNNVALGYLIRTYAELYPNVLEKDKRASAINLHKIIQTAVSRRLRDINVTMGSAYFYHHINRHETAIHIIENYFRVNAPSKKLFCLYLEVLIATERLTKAQKALEQVRNIVGAGQNVPVEAYVAMSKMYLFEEEEGKALNIIKEGIKKHPKSVPLLLQLAGLKVKELESLELSLKDPIFLKELSLFVKILKLIEKYRAENSPAYYARYLEFTGLVSAIQGDSETAAKLFKISLNINNSHQLRGKLATLSLEGGKAAEKLILENKIIDFMKKSKKALKEKKWKQAFSYILKAVEYNENYIPAQLLLVRIQIKRGYYDDVMKTLQELNKKYKKNKDIYVMLVDAYLKMKRFRDAYQAIIEMNRTQKLGQTPEFASLQGRYFLKKENDLLASKWFKESISRDPLDDINYFELAKIYLRNRNYSKSKLMLSKALALMPKKAEYHITYAGILYEYDSPEVAIGYLRKILESEKNNKEILSQVAIFYYRNGQHKEFELYKKELEKSVLDDARFYSFLVKASILDENREDIEKYSRLLLESDPGNIEARMLLGKTFYDAGVYVQAIEVFNSILERFKNYSQVYYYLAKIYMKQKKFKSALSLADKEIKGNPDLYYGYYIKGEIYRRMGKWKLSIRNLEKAISIDANAVETLIALGWINLRQNFVEKARELYLRAKERDKNNPEVRKQLGLIYQSIGQNVLAIDELKVYLQLKPDAFDKRDIEFLIRRLSR